MCVSPRAAFAQGICTTHASCAQTHTQTSTHAPAHVRTHRRTHARTSCNNSSLAQPRYIHNVIKCFNYMTIRHYIHFYTARRQVVAFHRQAPPRCCAGDFTPLAALAERWRAAAARASRATPPLAAPPRASPDSSGSAKKSDVSSRRVKTYKRQRLTSV